MPAASQGIRYTGLIHAADWLPSVVAGLGLRPLGPAETLPLDGVDCWAALLACAAHVCPPSLNPVHEPPLLPVRQGRQEVKVDEHKHTASR